MEKSFKPIGPRTTAMFVYDIETPDYPLKHDLVSFGPT